MAGLAQSASICSRSVSEHKSALAKQNWGEGKAQEMAAEAERTRKLDFEEIQIPPGPRLGSVVVEAKGLTKGFDDKLLIDNLSFTLPRNGIVGVIGPNGVGKTTLFKMIVAAAEGEVSTGPNRAWIALRRASVVAPNESHP